MTDEMPCLNTDRELWREVEGDYYANSVHATEGGGIGISVGGLVIVKTPAEWHEAIRASIEDEVRLLRSDCEFLLSVIDSCDEAEAPSCEMDPEDTARIDFIRASLSRERPQ